MVLGVFYVFSHVLRDLAPVDFLPCGVEQVSPKGTAQVRHVFREGIAQDFASGLLPPAPSAYAEDAP